MAIVLTLMLLGALDLFLRDSEPLAVRYMEGHLPGDMRDYSRSLNRSATSSDRFCSSRSLTAAISLMFLALYDERAFALAKCT